jgi:type II secretory pathway pseudopilin PulG
MKAPYFRKIKFGILKNKPAAFSLVEVVIAIGIFSFVIVGIFGLLPAALKLREDSSQDTHAVLVAEEIFSSVRSSESIRNVTLRDGPGLGPQNNVYPGANLTTGNLVLGYPSQTTVPFGLWHSSRGNDPDGLWETGDLPDWAVRNGIATLAKISAQPIPPPTGTSPTLYQIKVEVRSPASLPLQFSRPASFTTEVYSPPPAP